MVSQHGEPLALAWHRFRIGIVPSPWQLAHLREIRDLFLLCAVTETPPNLENKFTTLFQQHYMLNVLYLENYILPTRHTACWENDTFPLADQQTTLSRHDASD